MHTIIAAKKSSFDEVVAHLAKELGGLRTGRASPALVEDIKANAYDSYMEIKSIASIAIPDAKTITIQPWDKGLLQAIEKAIRDSGLGIAPAVDGELVRISLPLMSEENRKQLVKLVKEKIEEAKISMRRVREETKESVLKMEKDKKVGEDEKFKMLDELEKMTKEFTGKVDEIGAKKETEIMTV